MRYWSEGKVFITNGYGSTRVENAKAYFYLIGKDIGGLEQASEEFQKGKSELYIKASKSDDFAFSVIDFERSDGLERNLHTSPEGQILYEMIKKAVPCIVKAQSALIDVKDVSQVTIAKLNNFDQDFEWAKAEMRRMTLKERTKLVGVLRFLDENIKFEPGLAGVKWSGNVALKRWIKSLED